MALLGLGLLTVLVWRSLLATPDGRLHLEMLDVGSGDAFLIRTPAGRYLVVDGGLSTRALSDALGRRLPLDRRCLDWLVVASTSSEQIAALPDILPCYTPDQVLWSGAPLGTAAARDLQITLGQAAIPIHTAEAGQALDLGLGARLGVLGTNRSRAADLNPPEWLPAWERQLVLLSVAPGDRRARLAAEVLQAVQGRNLLQMT